MVREGATMTADDSAADDVEDFTLADGTMLRMRPLRPDDKLKIVEGLERMSPESRYLRFFTAKPRLSDAELRYLTEVDGHDHYAVGVGRIEPDGSEGPGVAVARYVRIPDEVDVAEPAIAVVDEMQGKGIGRRLMERLVAAAAARGVKRFRTEFLAVNDAMRDLVAKLSPEARFVASGPVVVAEFPIGTELAPASRDSPMYAWLRLVAERAVELRRDFAMLFDPAAVKAALQRVRREITGGRGSDDPADDGDGRVP
jgi:GNAT superfamily N-acetyltransferase